MKDSVRRLEEDIFTRVWKFGRSRPLHIWTTGRI
jgi:hypothetical protein